MDVTPNTDNFPNDVQELNMTFSTWSHTSDVVTLIGFEPLDLETYLKSPESERAKINKTDYMAAPSLQMLNAFFESKQYFKDH